MSLLYFLSCRETGDILLKICNLMPQDTGIYTCIAINDHGTASSSASIKVQGNVEKGDAQLLDVSFISIVQDNVRAGRIYYLSSAVELVTF